MFLINNVDAEIQKLTKELDSMTSYVLPSESSDLASLVLHKKDLIDHLEEHIKMLVKYDEMVRNGGSERLLNSFGHEVCLHSFAVASARNLWVTFSEKVVGNSESVADAKTCTDSDGNGEGDGDDEVTTDSEDEGETEDHGDVYSRERILERVGVYGYELNEDFLFGEEVEREFQYLLYDLYLGRLVGSEDAEVKEIFPRQFMYEGSYFYGGGGYKYKLPAPWSRLHACPDVERLREENINGDDDMIASPIPCYGYNENKTVMGTFVGIRYEYISQHTPGNRVAYSSADFYHPDLLRACLRPLDVPCPFYHYFKHSGNRYNWLCSCLNPPRSTEIPRWLSRLSDTPPEAYVVIPGVERRYLATRKRSRKKRPRSVGRKLHLTDGMKGRRNGKRNW